MPSPSHIGNRDGDPNVLIVHRYRGQHVPQTAVTSPPLRSVSSRCAPTKRTKSGSQRRQERRVTALKRLEEPLVTAAQEHALRLLQKELLGLESGHDIAAKLSDVRCVQDPGDSGITFGTRQRAYAILLAIHCLLVYEVVEKLSDIPDVTPKGLHKIVKRLQITGDSKGLAHLATIGFAYRKWTILNGDWVILFVGNGKLQLAASPAKIEAPLTEDFQRTFYDAMKEVRAKYSQNGLALSGLHGQGVSLMHVHIDSRHQAIPQSMKRHQLHATLGSVSHEITLSTILEGQSIDTLFVETRLTTKPEPIAGTRKRKFHDQETTSHKHQQLSHPTRRSVEEVIVAPSTTRSQSIGSTILSHNIDSLSPTPESRQSSTTIYVNYEAANQGLSPVVEQRVCRGDVQRFFSDSTKMSRSPLPPQALLVPEHLFRTIKGYFEASCQKMNFNEHGILVDRNGTRLNDDLCNDFDSYCFSATMLIGRRKEFVCALSKACALVKQILQAQHPRTLACFLEVLIHLNQSGLPDIANRIRHFIGSMSASVVTDGQSWGRICQLLRELDPNSLCESLAQIWKCTADAFESELGISSRLAISVRLDYLKRVYGVTKQLEEESRLRDLLHKLGGITAHSMPRVMLNLAHNLNRQLRYEEAEQIAKHVSSLLQEHEEYADRTVQRIECLKVISHSQFNQGNPEAEHTMRKAIGMIMYQWGAKHSWVLEFMNVLAGWLEQWCRDEDAHKLQEAIAVLSMDGCVKDIDWFGCLQ